MCVESGVNESDDETSLDNDEDLYNNIDAIYNDEGDKASTNSKVNSLFYNRYKRLQTQFTRYITQLPVISFNGANYDLNLVKNYIFTQLKINRKEGEYVIKRNNSYLSISTSDLLFLDVSQFIAPGYSYSQFLAAHDVKVKKGFFCYDYVDNPARLDETSLPPHEKFHSKLKGCNISEEDYRYVEKKWRKNKMRNIRDLLIWYNNRDTGPMVEGILKMLEFYSSRNIDLFKIAISVPGVSRHLIFNECKKSNVCFQLFCSDDEDLYRTVKANCVGGPSIIFKRHCKAGETKIRGGELVSKRIIGFDASALYLWSISQNMPTGCYVRRFAECNFKPEKLPLSTIMYEYLNYTAKSANVKINHKLNNNREFRIGPYLVDGFCEELNIVYEVSNIIEPMLHVCSLLCR